MSIAAFLSYRGIDLLGQLQLFNLEAISRTFGCRHFIETGTGSGDGLAFAASFPFETLNSIEIHPQIAAAATARFDRDSRIRIRLGKSVDLLPKLLGALPESEPILFWLDAHFPGADLGLARYDAEPDTHTRLPLERELEIIRSARPRARDVILIDDLRIYEEGPFANGNIPDWAQTLPPEMRHVQFINRLFAATHVFQRRYEDEGYLSLLPKQPATSGSPRKVSPVMKECGKAVFRRLSEPAFLTRYFVGKGLDIGSGDDPLSLYAQLFPQISEVVSWDQEQGDAQQLNGLHDESFDFVHSSHCLEHMVDPAKALVAWFRVLRPGGYMVLLVPDEDLYEQRVWPSSFNGDHKHTFTIAKSASWSPVSVNLVDLVRVLGSTAEIRKLALIDATFREDLPRFDQTLTAIGECAIELVVRKRPQKEAEEGGRRPPPGTLTDSQRRLLEIPAGVPTPGDAHQVGALREQLGKAENENSALRTELAEIRGSTSWRITRPLRRCMQALRRLGRAR